MTKNRLQRGFTLVSLLVGMLLSVLCALTAMQVWRVSVLNSTSSHASAEQQSISAALSVQLPRLVSQAGWGMGAGNATPGGTLGQDLVLLQGATFTGGVLSGSPVSAGSGSSVGNALIWSSSVSGAVTCSALVAQPATGLSLLGPMPCTNAAGAASASWSASTLLAGAEGLPPLLFNVSSASCWPYGEEAGRPSATLSVTGPAPALPGVCLLNIRS